MCTCNCLPLAASHQQSINYAAYLSGIVTFILLVSVIVYHVYCVLCAWCLQKLALSTSDDEESSQTIVNAPGIIQSSSEIEGLPNRDRQNSVSQDLDDMASIASTDGTTPLLDK